MRTSDQSLSKQRGFAHLGIIIAIAGVVVISGLIAWRFLGATKTGDSVTDAIAQKLASAKCEYDDKDLCKFFVSYKEHSSYKMVSTTTNKASSGKTTMTYEIDGDNTHSIMTGQYASETISIGERTTYTKAPNGTWWKQTLPEEQQPQDTQTTPTPELEEPTSEKVEEPSKTTYKALGKETCGSLSCFKYQVINSEAADSTEYIWFDTKSYQLRRTASDSPESSSDTTFSYDNVTVKAPSSFKELGPDQFLMPGENEPTTVPTAADYGN